MCRGQNLARRPAFADRCPSGCCAYHRPYLFIRVLKLCCAADIAWSEDDHEFFSVWSSSQTPLSQSSSSSSLEYSSADKAPPRVIVSVRAASSPDSLREESVCGPGAAPHWSEPPGWKPSERGPSEWETREWGLTCPLSVCSPVLEPPGRELICAPSSPAGPGTVSPHTSVRPVPPATCGSARPGKVPRKTVSRSGLPCASSIGWHRAAAVNSSAFVESHAASAAASWGMLTTVVRWRRAILPGRRLALPWRLVGLLLAIWNECHAPVNWRDVYCV